MPEHYEEAQTPADVGPEGLEPEGPVVEPEEEVPIARVVFVLEPGEAGEALDDEKREEARSKLIELLEQYAEGTRSTELPIYFYEDDDDWQPHGGPGHGEGIGHEMPHLPEGPDDMVAPPMEGMGEEPPVL